MYPYPLNLDQSADSRLEGQVLTNRIEVFCGRVLIRVVTQKVLRNEMKSEKKIATVYRAILIQQDIRYRIIIVTPSYYRVHELTSY